MNKNPKHDVFADTWVGTDALGRSLPGVDECGPPRPDRFVGIFYFICNNYTGQDKPYDVTKTIAENPSDPPFVGGKPYFWGEPELGYYRSNDRWVIRQHAYLLADAGVDTLIFDVTNDVTFPETYLAICEVFSQIRAEGESTPDICFLASEKSIYQVWENLYAAGRYSDLWFRWKGKPLLIFGQWEKRGDMNLVTFPDYIQDFFTIRNSWAWDSLSWYGDGRDNTPRRDNTSRLGGTPLGYHRWPWVAHTPQCIGWDQPGVAEMVPVAVGQHPLSNIGRSFHDGSQPPTNAYDVTAWTDQGLHFAEQWKRALEVDPEFIFITGWNEWTAGSAVCEDPSQEALQALWDFFPGAVLGRAGKELRKGDRYFIDQYNQEYSRDAEPMKGGHSDNYYYQMLANIRRFKGVRSLPKASKPVTIDPSGSFTQWKPVQPEYRDHLYETEHRNEPGWGSSGPYVNRTGRNEFVRAKVTSDEKMVYFYAQTRLPISPTTDPNWMMLFLDIDQSVNTGYLGYDYVINWPVLDAGRTTVKKNIGGWNWELVGEAWLRVEGNQLMLGIARDLLGLDQNPILFDFHWCDNLSHPGDLGDFLVSGDSAPSRRANFRYQGTPA